MANDTQKGSYNSSDLFRHENESVDLFLQELNVYGKLQMPLQNDEASPSVSPVKPLNCQTQKASEPQKTESQENLKKEHSPDSMRRDFNSSSDTCVSDHEENENGRVVTGGDNSPSTEKNEAEAERYEQGSIVSPSKSIMKTSVSSVSPKKSVVFQPSLDTFHTYTLKEPEITKSPEPVTPVKHSWQEMNQSATSLESAASPPAPPPHTSNTITGLLKSPTGSDSSDKESELHSSTHIDSFKKSNLSLNEKLHVFLNSPSPANNDDLDTHLDQLGKASKAETDVNIHRLSYHLEDYDLKTEEDPFNALTKSSELYLNSAHSSQSSLQSLIDSNRQLQAEVVDISSRGIQFNDGIKGFPNTVAASLISLIKAEEDSFSDSPSVGSQFSYTQLEHQVKTEAEPSHDQSYNSTEKSILNLLSSASLAEFPSETNAIQSPVKLENATGIKNEDESDANSREWAVATNPDTHSIIKTETPEPQISVKSEGSGEEELNKEVTNESHETEQCDGQKEVPVVKLEYPHDSCNLREHINLENTQIENFHNSSSTTTKSEDNGIKIKPRSMSEASEIKREETEQQMGSNMAKDIPGEKEAEIKDGTEIRSQSIENDNGDRFTFETQFDDTHSDEDFSFSHDGLDLTTEFHTFRVDKGTIAPGQVKLVRSAESPTNMPDKVITSKPSEEPSLTSSKYDGASEIEPVASGRIELESKHYQASDQSSDSDSDSDSDSINSKEYKDSVEYSSKSLAPPRYEDSEPDSSQPPHELEAKEVAKASSNVSNMMVTTGDSLTAQDCDSSVLANSSNVDPPMDIKLPVMETDENEFADLTEQINERSFEGSLSAEHDAEKESLNFLSIWHSQSLNRSSSKPAPGFYKVPSISKYNTADISQHRRHEIPSSLKPKRFTDVNLVSTGVVSSAFDDLNVSGFLPELSQDSGLEGHFEALMKNDLTLEWDRTADTVVTKVSRRRSLQSSEILSGLERKTSGRVMNQKSLNNRRRSMHESTRPGANTLPGAESDLNFSSKKSKFYVPSFEIKRSNSVLSPKNQYNDIFQDGSFSEPTIKAPGMKTLPSMDRDDVKRIMQMKQAMSVEEYSGLKNVRAQTVFATKQEPQDRYEVFQQRASIYCDSLASKSATIASKFRDNRDDGDSSGSQASRATQKNVDYNYQSRLGSVISSRPTDNSHVFNLLLEKPVAIQSANALRMEDKPANLGKSSLIKERKSTDHPREPDGDIFTFASLPQKHELDSHIADAKSPNQSRNVLSHNPFRTSAENPVLVHQNFTSDGDKGRLSSDEYSSRFLVKSRSEVTSEKLLPESPEKKSARSSPIKINLPLKVIRQNGSVTGVVLDKKPKDVLETQELHNKKLRDDKTRLSTVSVPSVLSDTSSKPRVHSNDTQEPEVSKRIRSRESLSHDRPQGKLFFRVVGLRNVSLPEAKDQNVAFSVTLDNGIHSIKTPNYQLDSDKVDIGKEFELSVSDSLEFILTLKATYSKPKQGFKEVQERKIVKSKNKLSRLLGSKEIVTTTKFVAHDISDPLGRVFATDGSFGRCYIDLDSYKSQITGQARNYNLACFNEWATYTHNGIKVAKKPYQIAQLEVKMLYIPRNEQYEILPTSIKSAYECLDDLKFERSLALEGYLHQEGGDCETWKRRWFKLEGTSLIAHSEFSHKTRAKINLSKVVEVIFVNKEKTMQSSLNYRNFSDILLVENSFKIRFANGEVIEFGAPSRTEKALWIKTIQEIVYRNKFRRQPWVKLMQERNGEKRASWIKK